MKILIAPYSFSNAQIDSGVVLKVVWGAYDIGYADLICHPHLGDLSLQTHIESLVKSQPTDLVKRALSFAIIDARARRQGRHLLYGLALPRSHKRVRTVEEAKLALDLGFSHLKIKMGKDLQADAKLLEEIHLSGPGLKLRLDFNGQLNFVQFQQWWKSISVSAKSQVDFIEDAFAGQGHDGADLDAPLAWDWLKPPTTNAKLYRKIRVIKPSHHSVDDIAPTDRVIFTHSMGHWIGQSAALWVAARFYQKYPHQLEVCGLLPTPYLQEWPQRGAHLVPPSGTGFGLDEIMQSQKWERLV